MDYSRIDNSNQFDISSFLSAAMGLGANQSLVSVSIGQDGRITEIEDISALVYALMQSNMRMLQLQRLQQLRQVMGQVQVMERHPEVDADTGAQRVTLRVHGQRKNELADSHAPVMFEGQEVRADLEVDEELATKVDNIAGQLLVDLETVILEKQEGGSKAKEESRTQFGRAAKRSEDVADIGEVRKPAQKRGRESAVDASRIDQEKEVQDVRNKKAKTQERDRQDGIEKEQIESLEANRARTKKSQGRG